MFADDAFWQECGSFATRPCVASEHPYYRHYRRLVSYFQLFGASCDIYTAEAFRMLLRENPPIITWELSHRCPLEFFAALNQVTRDNDHDVTCSSTVQLASKRTNNILVCAIYHPLQSLTVKLPRQLKSALKESEGRLKGWVWVTNSKKLNPYSYKEIKAENFAIVPFDLFTIPLQETRFWLQGRRLNEDEITTLERAFDTKREHLPRLPTTEPIAQLRGWPQGSVVYIQKPHLTQIHRPRYYYVTRFRPTSMDEKDIYPEETAGS